MTAIGPSRVIDAEARRAHLPSQWPLMARDWALRFQGAPGARGGAIAFARQLMLLAALCAAIAAIGLLAVWGADGGGPREILAPIVIALLAFYASFGVSMAIGRPAGLFWISALIEQTQVRKARAPGGRAHRPAHRRRAASNSLPAPRRATADARSRV